MALYKQLVRSNMVTSLLTSSGGANEGSALACIMAMRKLCNHPDMLFVGDDMEASGVKADLHPLYPARYQLGQPQHSGVPRPFFGLCLSTVRATQRFSNAVILSYRMSQTCALEVDTHALLGCLRIESRAFCEGFRGLQ